ncbi:MAG: response regulator [Abitibacteriaceae bacterium]|nr:response regulator [Abditibacteriaceae bacterium]
MTMLEKLRQSRILIVDDAADNVAMLEMLLHTAQYEQLRGTSDPFRALPLFHEFQPDLILLDLMMPGLNGFEVMAQLAPHIPADTYLPILVLTGDDSSEAKQRALAGGAHDFLAKPFDATEVLLRIQNLLQTRRLHLDLQQQNHALEEQVQEASRRRRELQITLSALAASEERWRLALEAAHLGKWDWQVHGVTEPCDLNQQLGNCEVYLTGPDENFAGNFQDFLQRIAPEDQPVVQATLTRAMQGCTDYELEFRLLTPNDATRWIVARGHAICETDEQTGASLVRVLGVVMDITERKAAEQELNNSRQQLRALTQRLEASIETERTHIAREIHDELGSILTGLKMDMRALQEWLNQPALPGSAPGTGGTATSEPATSEPATTDLVRSQICYRLDVMSQMVQDMVQIVRKIATELRPSVLDDLGLEAAVEWQVREFQRRTGIACHCASNLGDLEVSPELSTALFRILQEALTNIIRHAQATQVGVILEQTTSAPSGETHQAVLLLRVQDNGRGIAAAEIANFQSLGLLGMQERAALFGGQVVVTGSAGTTVEVCVPI